MKKVLSLPFAFISKRKSSQSIFYNVHASRLVLFFLAICWSVGANSQTTVTHVQQTGNYCTSFTAGGASGSFNQGTFQMGMYANTSGAKQSANWRNFTTNGTSPCSNLRSLQVGDQVVITLSAKRAYGRIGFALLASPVKLSWADRESNYALSVNLDGPLYLGGSTYGNWYIKYNGGSTSAASFGGQQTTFQNFTFTMTLTAVDRMNVSITNNSTSTTSTFYDVLLNNSNPITDYSVFLEDDWDGGAQGNIYWGLGASNQQHTVTDNRTMSIGQSNGTFTVSSVLPDGIAANLNSGSVANNLIKVGTGTLTLTGANTYTGLTTVNAGILQFNRTGGTTIPVGNSVTVNSGGTLKISTDQQLATLTLNAGSILLIDPGVSLTAATVTGSGTITGSSTSNLIITGTGSTLNFTQTTASTRSLNNLTLNTGSSATLGTALDVYGTIGLTTASLNLNTQNLTLKSNSTGTARIADLTGSTLSGETNVTVERYIPASGRKYRLLAPTVTTATSIKTNWMETGMNTVVGTNVNPAATYGTQVTGSGGNSNGFDVTQSNAASLYHTANALVPTYTAAANTTDNLNPLTGYFLFIRGDRTMDMTLANTNVPPTPVPLPTSSTTLRATGTIVQGPVTGFTNPLIGAGAFNLVTNPYPSPINWNSVYTASSNITAFYTLWDPNFGYRGGFVTVSTAGVPSSGAANQFIQSGQAFFVEALAGTPVISIQESHKSAGNNNGVFLVDPPPVQSFGISLYYTEGSGFRRIADGAKAVYDNNYSATVDANDAKEINNWDENIAINRGGKHLAIESRPVIGKYDDLPVFMNNMKQQAYEFQFEPAVFTNTGLKAELIDNFLNTRTLLSVVHTTVVPFTITADAASKATDRFMVVFSAKPKQPIDVITIKAQAANNGVAVNWTAKTENDMDRYELERANDGTVFTMINTIAAIGNSQSAVNYSWVDDNPKTGDNFYRIKAIDKTGTIKYTDVVKVPFVKTSPSISVSPNPVSGNTIRLQLSAIEKGSYNVSVINNQGQRVYTTQLQHAGGSVSRVLTPGALVSGLYKIELAGEHVRMSNWLIKN